MLPKQERRLVHTMDWVHTYNPVHSRVESVRITEDLTSSLHHTRTCPRVFLLEIPAERAKLSYA